MREFIGGWVAVAGLYGLPALFEALTHAIAEPTLSHIAVVIANHVFIAIVLGWGMAIAAQQGDTP